MYESPVKIYTIPTSLTAERYDDAILCEILDKIDVEVDKEGLLKALMYDRNQYMCGYQDGIQCAEHKPIEADWEPYGHEEEEYFWVGECGNCHENVFGENYCPNCGAKLIKPDREIWWKPEKKEEPKPEKPKPEGHGECWSCRHGAWNDLEQDWECYSVCPCQYWEDRKVNGDG